MHKQESGTPHFDDWISRYSEALNSAVKKQRPDIAPLTPDIQRYLAQTESYTNDHALETMRLAMVLRKYYRDILNPLPLSFDESVESVTKGILPITEGCGARIKIAELRGDCIRAHVVERYPLQEAQTRMIQIMETEYGERYGGIIPESPSHSVKVAPPIIHHSFDRQTSPDDRQTSPDDRQTSPGSLSPEKKAAFLKLLDSPDDLGRFVRAAYRIDMAAMETQEAVARAEFIQTNPDPAAFVEGVIDASTLRDIIRRSTN
ncbi:hypothetical protein JXD20_01830 [Candidatus Peregrinibacteria bacterium]|nr:hypothetical protein [Candidatus Peregrinibacteria bacterium]